MNEAMFADLLESVREGGAILCGEVEPAQQHEINASDVKKIRYESGMSQSEFAALLGISIKTLQNWEQGRRTPYGADRVLLHVAAKHPDAVWDVVEPTMPK